MLPRKKSGESSSKLEEPANPRLMNAAPVAVSLTPQSNTTREEFHEMVRRAKRHIEAGDIFQMVPSQRFEARIRGKPAHSVSSASIRQSLPLHVLPAAWRTVRPGRQFTGSPCSAAGTNRRDPPHRRNPEERRDQRRRPASEPKNCLLIRKNVLSI